MHRPNASGGRTIQSIGVTELLAAHRAGDGSALEQAFVLVYAELRRLAHRQLGSGSIPTLNTTSLVNELYLKLVDRSDTNPSDRAHFMAIASRAMRQIIIDYARERATRKRGGGVRHVSLDKAQISVEDQAGQLLEIDRAIDGLASVDERLVHIVECRFFAGLTEAETAEALGTSVSTVQRDWKRAKAWLSRFMGEK